MTTDELLLRLQEEFPGMPWERLNETDNGPMSIACIDWATTFGCVICVEYAPACRADFPWRLRGTSKDTRRFSTLEELLQALATEMFTYVGAWKNSLAEVDEMLTARINREKTWKTKT